MGGLYSGVGKDPHTQRSMKMRYEIWIPVALYLISVAVLWYFFGTIITAVVVACVLGLDIFLCVMFPRNRGFGQRAFARCLGRRRR